MKSKKVKKTKKADTISYSEILVLYRDANYFKVIECLSTVDVSDMRFVYILALSYMRTDDFRHAKAAFNAVITSDIDIYYKLQSYMLLGYMYVHEGDYKHGEEQMHELLKLNYENPQIYSILGYIYSKRKDYAQAEYYYKKSLALDPENPNTNNGIGCNYLDWETKLDEAYRYIEKAHEQDKKNGAYLDSLGWFYYLKKNMSKALYFIKRAFQLHKHSEISSHLKKVEHAMEEKV
jgi:Flp pilus assembly protein TadD